MDIFTRLSNNTDYTKSQLQLILGVWVLSTVVEPKVKVHDVHGDVLETDYTKNSIYALLYSLYRTVGTVSDENGIRYEFGFNTWGYTWPEGWGTPPAAPNDPERFGKFAYTGLYQFAMVQDFVKSRDGRVHVIEMGCGTGAGAHHVVHNVLPRCTYEALDMQQAAINTANRRFTPTTGGRMMATCINATQVNGRDAIADIVAVCETHVTEMPGVCTDEDKAFFNTAKRMLKPGGFLVWGNAIPESTWAPCFEYLESIGMKVIEVRDVTKEAVMARDQDKARAHAYVDQALNQFAAFKFPVVGKKKRKEAELAMKNFYRDPGTNLYNNMVDGTDTYKVVLIQKLAQAEA